MEITGTIKNAEFVNEKWEIRSPCISGEVYGDTKGRYHDGERVTTSKIEQVYAAEGGVIVKTRFSAYLVEFRSLD